MRAAIGHAVGHTSETDTRNFKTGSPEVNVFHIRIWQVVVSRSTFLRVHIEGEARFRRGRLDFE
jgi:hypothetical protein